MDRREYIRLLNTLTSQQVLIEVTGNIPAPNAHKPQRGREYGDRISVQMSTVNGMELGDQELRDSLLFYHQVYPSYLSQM